MKKIVVYGILPLLLILLAVWAFCGTAGSDSYHHQGYIVDMRDSEDGTVITTLSGDKTAEFTLKWYTRKKFSGELTALKEGAFIKLSTTRNSDSNIKKFSAYNGFSMEGKIVFVEEVNSPFLLTVSQLTNSRSLYSLISSQEISYPLQTGTQVKVYHQYPLNAGNVTVVVDAVQPLTDVLSELTEEDLAYIELLRYTVASK